MQGQTDPERDLVREIVPLLGFLASIVCSGHKDCGHRQTDFPSLARHQAGRLRAWEKPSPTSTGLDTATHRGGLSRDAHDMWPLGCGLGMGQDGGHGRSGPGRASPDTKVYASALEPAWTPRTSTRLATAPASSPPLNMAASDQRHKESGGSKDN